MKPSDASKSWRQIAEEINRNHPSLKEGTRKTHKTHKYPNCCNTEWVKSWEDECQWLSKCGMPPHHRSGPRQSTLEGPGDKTAEKGWARHDITVVCFVLFCLVKLSQRSHAVTHTLLGRSVQWSVLRDLTPAYSDCTVSSFPLFCSCGRWNCKGQLSFTEQYMQSWMGKTATPWPSQGRWKARLHLSPKIFKKSGNVCSHQGSEYGIWIA